MSSTPPVPPVALQRQVLQVQEAVKGAVIHNADEYAQAGLISRSIAALRKAIGETFDPIIEAAHKTHKEAIQQRQKFLLPLELDQRKIDGLILNWDREQEQMRRRKEAELAAQMKKEQEDRALAEAAEYQRQGDAELAEEVLKQEAEAPAPVVALPNPVPKIEGFSKRTVWRWRIQDEKLIPREYLCVDDVKISGMVRALKNATKIPGVQVYSEDIASHTNR